MKKCTVLSICCANFTSRRCRARLNFYPRATLGPRNGQHYLCVIFESCKAIVFVALRSCTCLRVLKPTLCCFSTQKSVIEGLKVGNLPKYAACATGVTVGTGSTIYLWRSGLAIALFSFSFKSQRNKRVHQLQFIYISDTNGAWFKDAHCSFSMPEHSRSLLRSPINRICRSHC